MEKLNRNETAGFHNRHVNAGDEQVSAMEDALLSKGASKSACFQNFLRLVFVLIYYVVGAAVFCHVEERPCDDQPTPLVMTGVNVTIDGVLCEDCTFVQEVEECIQKWTILDAVYFGTVTVTTVGYGDLAPSTVVGRGFAFVYLLYGLGVVFTIISECAHAVINQLEERALKKMSMSTRQENEKDVIRRFYAKSTLSVSVMAIIVFLGGLAYSELEDWSIMEGMWWAFATTTTIGYGDLTITKSATKLFSVFFILVSVVIMALAIGQLSSVAFELAQERKKHKLLSANLNPRMIAAMDLNGDGVDRFEFVIGMLKLLDQISEEQVAPWSARFDQLDEDASGILDEDDLRRLGAQLESIVHETTDDDIGNSGWISSCFKSRSSTEHKPVPTEEDNGAIELRHNGDAESRL